MIFSKIPVFLFQMSLNRIGFGNRISWQKQILLLTLLSKKKGMNYQASQEQYQSMIYRRTGKSGVLLPAISLGLWHNFGGVDNFESGRAILRIAFDAGITHFDLANNYGPPAGSAEENFGKILEMDFRTYRDQMIISTKAGYYMWPGPYGEWGSRKYLVSSLDQSLKRMRLEYVPTVPIRIPRWKKL
jgi:L-glyceraldehyde 3-phosphate reductase